VHTGCPVAPIPRPTRLIPKNRIAAAGAARTTATAPPPTPNHVTHSANTFTDSLQYSLSIVLPYHESSNSFLDVRTYTLLDRCIDRPGEPRESAVLVCPVGPADECFSSGSPLRANPSKKTSEHDDRAQHLKHTGANNDDIFTGIEVRHRGWIWI